MKITPFELERYFAKHEFSSPFLLSCSDAEPLEMKELLAMADQETRSLWDNLTLGYTESQGHSLLLKEIANLYDGIRPESIVEIVPEEGIFIAMNVLLAPGDHVITTFPGYQSLFEIAISIGCQVDKWLPDLEDTNKFSLDVLKRLIRKNTKLIVINFPHNPTGALLNHAELKELIEIAKSKGIRIFSDEMYRYSEQNQTDQLPAACEIFSKGISLSGLSKSFSLPGLRVGWLVSSDPVIINKIKYFKDYTTICGAAPSEILAIIALRAKDTILARNQSIISRNLKILSDFFEKYDSIFSWHRPAAGTICFPKLLLDISIDEFCKLLMEKKGVMLLPASVIGFPGNYFRVGFGRKNMPEVLEKVTDFLAEMKFSN
jgi:aspartate/methionine/tyrosine aminotransferase